MRDFDEIENLSEENINELYEDIIEANQFTGRVGIYSRFICPDYTTRFAYNLDDGDCGGHPSTTVNNCFVKGSWHWKSKQALCGTTDNVYECIERCDSI